MNDDQKLCAVLGVFSWAVFAVVGLAFDEIKFLIAGIVVLVAAFSISVVIGD